ncbi:MAG: hypothetical protein EZS28_016438 [Streblomastix strix]|uniref:Uncharacterized protein n=1 Tax=Streblomastix strix TaxID=222440 RepID=A0A5J4VZC8_9EUKA|nr:MAG: hypothetical protein EZS28_016438 [Streblomastix strix]
MKPNLFEVPEQNLQFFHSSFAERAYFIAQIVFETVLISEERQKVLSILNQIDQKEEDSDQDVNSYDIYYYCNYDYNVQDYYELSEDNVSDYQIGIESSCIQGKAEIVALFTLDQLSSSSSSSSPYSFQSITSSYSSSSFVSFSVKVMDNDEAERDESSSDPDVDDEEDKLDDEVDDYGEDVEVVEQDEVIDYEFGELDVNDVEN